MRVYWNAVRSRRNRPREYTGPILKLGPRDMRYPITMGKVKTKGDDIKATAPFVDCNLADFINDEGRFNLVGFLHLQRVAFPTIYKLVVCLASIRTNEVGCESFFSTAGYVSCPKRTRLNVRNYECLSALKANMQHVYIDEEWVVNKYLAMEKNKSWNELESKDDMQVLNLERDLLADSLGVASTTLPPISTEPATTMVDLANVDDDD